MIYKFSDLTISNSSSDEDKKEEGNFKFVCECCNFKTNSHWNHSYHLKSKKHLIKSGEIEPPEKRLYHCHFCLYTTKSSAGLNEHHKKKHKNKTKINDWECKTCQKFFSTKDELYIHLRTDLHIKECYQEAFDNLIEREKQRHIEFKKNEDKKMLSINNE